MIVEQIWTAKTIAISNYLIAAAETGERLRSDPLDPAKGSAAKERAGRFPQNPQTPTSIATISGQRKGRRRDRRQGAGARNAQGPNPGMDRCLQAGDVI